MPRRPLHRRARRRARPALDGDRRGRALRAGRHRRLSVLGADERDARPRSPGWSGWSWSCRRRTASSTRWCWRRPSIAGIDEIYRVGGAQAVAALAYGTDDDRAGRQDRRPRQRLCRGGQAAGVRRGRHRHDRRPVRDPGRRRPAATIRPGSPPTCCRRPSTTSAAQSILITDDAALRRRSREGRSQAQLATLPRAAIARRQLARLRRDHRRRKLGRGACRWSTASRPSISSWRCDDAEGLAARIRHAGAIFLGAHTPEAIGDYIAGPNHVLPTARSARFASGLGVLDFMKRTTIVGCDAGAVARARSGGDRARRGRGPRRARPLGRDALQSAMTRRPTRAGIPAASIAGSRSTSAPSAAPPRHRARARDRDHRSAEDNRFTPRIGCAGPFNLHLERRRQPAGRWRSATRRRAGDGDRAVAGAVPPHRQGLLPGLRELLRARSAPRRPTASRRSTSAAARCTTRARRC